VTAASSILCVSVGLIAPTSSDFELNRFLLRPLAIIALGYTLAYWGGTELALKKKLILLKELSKVANPRFGVDRTIEQMLRRLLDFYNADHCVLLLDQFIGSQFYHATHHSVLTGSLSSDAEVEIRKFLEQESNSCPGVFKNPDSQENRRATYTRCDLKSNRLLSSDPAPAKSLAGHLKANSMIAVTCQYREQYCGRLLVSSARTNAFEIVDAGFLLQIANQILPLIENIRLVDRLAMDASEAERQRIARSVHDRVIQPYYGLQIGLKALQGLLISEEQSRKVNVGSNAYSRKPERLLEQLMAMTAEGINELREYVYGLKQTTESSTRLADSIRRFAGKFENATGIRVDVDGGIEAIATNDRLTTEVFQMTTEALSNIHRHTQARSAQVIVNVQRNNLILRVENETDRDVGPVRFKPISISERADALGGSTEVLWHEGLTILQVEVPL
jgi:signal transduction histidine kinase